MSPCRPPRFTSMSNVSACVCKCRCMCEAAYQKKKHTHTHTCKPKPLLPHPSRPSQQTQKTPSNNVELNPGFHIKANLINFIFQPQLKEMDANSKWAKTKQKQHFFLYPPELKKKASELFKIIHLHALLSFSYVLS